MTGQALDNGNALIGLQWDFCELTYNDTQLFANISFVDFVSRSRWP